MTCTWCLTDMSTTAQSAQPECISRGNAFSRVSQLSPISPLLSPKFALTVTQNKKQLMDIIGNDLKNVADFTREHKLVITGEDETPVEINPEGICHTKKRHVNSA